MTRDWAYALRSSSYSLKFDYKYPLIILSYILKYETMMLKDFVAVTSNQGFLTFFKGDSVILNNHDIHINLKTWNSV